MDVRSSLNDRNKYYVIGGLLLGVIALVITTQSTAGLNEETISEEAFNANSVSLEAIDSRSPAIHLSSEGNQAVISGELYYTSKKPLLVRIYDSDGDIVKGDTGNGVRISDEDNSISLISLPTNGPSESTNYWVCFTDNLSNSGEWGKPHISSPTDNVICETHSIELPSVDLSITPPEVEFDLNPQNSEFVTECSERAVSVRNEGGYAVSVTPALKNNRTAGGTGSQPSLRVTSDNSEVLSPSESTEFQFQACATEGDTDFQTVGYIAVGTRYGGITRTPSITEFPFTINTEVAN